MKDGVAWTDEELARLRLEGLDRLSHLVSGAATERDAAELVAWRLRSRAHEEAFRSAVRLRQHIQTGKAHRALKGNGDPAAPEGNILPFRPADPVLSRRMVLGGSMAACFAGGILVAGRSLDLVPAPAEWRADYRTGPGEQRLVQLARGATAELNTRTSIDMRRDMAMPAVELISGEALMTSPRGGLVALAAGKGLSIGRDGHFNARRDGDDVCITCLSGLVDVQGLERSHRLRAHDQLRYGGQGEERLTRNIDVTALTSWKAGTLVFQDMPMRAVVAEINRYRPGHVFLVNETLASRSLSGTYHIDRLDDFFDQSRIGLGVRVTRIPGNVVILS
jgi:transmembrane sensor